MNKGFTLVELIAVIVILALLVIITTPAYDSISRNINTRNYESKKSTIKAQTLAYVEKYMKNDVYSGSTNAETVNITTDGVEYKYRISKETLCFTPDYLIRNGIISSDDDEKEYIKNEKDNTTYKGSGKENVYIKIYYNLDSLKLNAIIVGEEAKIKAYSEDNKTTTATYDFGTSRFGCSKIDGIDV